MSKIIVHIDLNAFFVTCEELKNPNVESLKVGIANLKLHLENIQKYGLPVCAHLQ